MVPGLSQDPDRPTPPSTGWVGRGSGPRSWWRDGVPLVVMASLVTFNVVVAQERRLAWVVAVNWALAVGILAWSYYGHRTGRVRGGGRVDRWIEGHRVSSAVITIALLVVVLAVARAVR